MNRRRRVQRGFLQERRALLVPGERAWIQHASRESRESRESTKIAQRNAYYRLALHQREPVFYHLRSSQILYKDQLDLVPAHYHAPIPLLMELGLSLVVLKMTI